MVKPLVSILIPVYNRETLIGSCIQSAIEQTIKDIEIIIIDNASTDATWQVCQEYARQDSRIRIFRNTQNIGPVRNWQRCIEEAKGKYGKMLFSDDLIHPQYLEKTIPLLDDPDVAFVFTRVCIGEREWEGGNYYEYCNIDKLINVDQYLKDCVVDGSLPVSPGCALFRLYDLKKNLHFTIPSPTINDFDKHGAGPDLLLFLLSAVCYKKIAYVNETLAFFRSHAGSITISDKARCLLKCYLQAKIWFAEQYKNELLDELLIRGWLAEIRAQRSFINYKDFINQYIHNDGKRNIKFTLVIKVLVDIIMDKNSISKFRKLVSEVAL